MVEQPLARGADQDMEGVESTLPIGADESILDLAEYREIGHLYDVLNIKLDKCGGLTEALAITGRALKHFVTFDTNCNQNWWQRCQ